MVRGLQEPPLPARRARRRPFGAKGATATFPSGRRRSGRPSHRASPQAVASAAGSACTSRRHHSSSLFGCPTPPSARRRRLSLCPAADVLLRRAMERRCHRLDVLPSRAPSAAGGLRQAPPFGLWPSAAAPQLGAAVAAWARRRLPQGAAPLPALEASRHRPLAPAPQRPSPAGVTTAGPKRRRLQVRARTPFAAVEGRRNGAPSSYLCGVHTVPPCAGQGPATGVCCRSWHCTAPVEEGRAPRTPRVPLLLPPSMAVVRRRGPRPLCCSRRVLVDSGECLCLV